MVLHRAPAGVLVACMAALALCGCPDDTRRGTGEGDDLTPGQVIGAARAINVGEVEQATAVQGRVADPELSTMVDRIVQDHRAALQSLEQVSTQLGLVGEESDLSRELQEDLQERTGDLTGKQGDDLTDDFLEAQIEGHEKALEVIDDTLMPATSEPTLQQYLTELRGLVAAHLEMARAHKERDEGRAGDAGRTGETTPQGERAPARDPTRETAPSGEPTPPR